MIRARFRLWLPDGLWVAEVSRSFPDASLRLLTGVPVDDRTLELGETRADDPRAVAEAIRAHPDVHSLELLHCDEERSLSKYETSDQALFEFLGGSSLIPEFPLVVEDGTMSFAITASRADFEAFGDRLDASGLRYELQSVVHRDDPSGGPLTDRQRECLTVAWRMGYFAVPRDCSLAEVADALDVDTSTVSETVRRGTERVLEQFFSERRRFSNR
ncbi:Predicted DNA binding protein, contains HTH domain [Halogeometricum rufum]|uniref:Predicted DNA binding protein, contains HTH domain n=1 Tax=Halogeometricum rufum TaxID=553469 RepID=A0A1I6J926_9EURY|nr:helix-turn-helix domain-containing protein [Halogeometricum rufum]SFR75472.1 Predicted DNA binding protein, contains HTH domain [Halogeometricum rufum]